MGLRYQVGLRKTDRDLHRLPSGAWRLMFLFVMMVGDAQKCMDLFDSLSIRLRDGSRVGGYRSPKPDPRGHVDKRGAPRDHTRASICGDGRPPGERAPESASGGRFKAQCTSARRLL
jgi:hypothetical protein